MFVADTPPEAAAIRQGVVGSIHMRAQVGLILQRLPNGLYDRTTIGIQLPYAFTARNSISTSFCVQNNPVTTRTAKNVCQS